MGTIIKMEKITVMSSGVDIGRMCLLPLGPLKPFLLWKIHTYTEVKSSEEYNEHSSIHQWVSQVTDL